ncbi:MAG: hypothetical protein GEU90_21885 [Gemmatimonas sp.]|nr:hypothetical protein [Gemmatimonas sp.]
MPAAISMLASHANDVVYAVQPPRRHGHVLLPVNLKGNRGARDVPVQARLPEQLTPVDVEGEEFPVYCSAEHCWTNGCVKATVQEVGGIDPIERA